MTRALRIAALALAFALPASAARAQSALIKFTQTGGAGVGTAGRAMLGVTGLAVSIANNVNTSVASWQIDMAYSPPASTVPITTMASANSNNTPAASFTPDVSGSYRIVLKVWGITNRVGAPTSTDIRVFSVAEGVNGFVRPPAQIFPTPLPDPLSGLAGNKPNEMNFSGCLFGYAGCGSDGLLDNFIATVDKRTQRSASTIAALASIPDAGFSVGQLAYVQTVGDFFAWHSGQTLTTTATTVVNGPTGQWTRVGVANQTFIQAKFWSVGTGGSDEAQGWGVSHSASDAVKLATMGELNRRLVGYDGSIPGWYPGGGFSGPSIHLTSAIDAASFSVLRNLKTHNSNSFARIFADPVLVDGGASNLTITSYQAAVPATNTERIVTISGLGTTPQYVARAMIKSDATKFAWITRQPATNQLAISQVRVYSTVPGGAANEGSVGSVSDFVNGDVVSIYDMQSIPDWPYDPAAKFPILANVRVGSSDTTYFPHGEIGFSSPYIMQCIFGNPARTSSYELFGGQVDSSGNGIIDQPMFTGTHNSLHNASLAMYSVAAVNTTASPFIDNCQLTFYGELNLAGGAVGWPSPAGPGVSQLNFPQQNGTQIATFGASYPFGFFALSPTDHHDGRADFYMDDSVKWYGTISGAAFALAPLSRVRLAVDGITAVTPGAYVSGSAGAGGQIIVNAGGTSTSRITYKNFSDVPFFDSASGTSVAGHQ